jgi:hypothetical protein
MYSVAGLPAQDSACAGGRFVPYFGWDRTECTNCAIYGSYIEYLGEPRLGGIRSDGPAAGRLQEHDLLIAVDGAAITTPEAWHKLRDAKPGQSVHFTVRNDGGTREESIRASGRCIPVAPAGIIVVRRRPGRA